MQVMA